MEVAKEELKEIPQRIKVLSSVLDTQDGKLDALVKQLAPIVNTHQASEGESDTQKSESSFLNSLNFFRILFQSNHE